MKSVLFYLSVAASLVLVFLGAIFAFYVAPLEAKMGFVQKIFYFHVPAAWVMFLSVAVCAVASVVYLVTRREGADRAAVGAAELAAVFGIEVLVTGPLWAWKAWGTPWVWDVRLTSTLLLWLVFLAYLMVRAFGGGSSRALSAGLAIFGVIQIPLIYFAVDLWRGTHPPRLVAKGGLDGDMRLALFTASFGFVFLFAALYALRLSLGRDRARLDDLHLLAEEAGLEEP